MMKKLTNMLSRCGKLVGRHRKRRCTANHIQILTVIGYTLREYYSQVMGRDEDVIEILGLPYDFRERCPLCRGRDCVQFIGYYPRRVVDERGTYYKAFPVARYLCKLFRYALIAPVIQENVSVQANYFREVSGKHYDVPHIGQKRFKAGTLKLWLKQYRRYGFDALKPKTRKDKGDSRKITGELALAIGEAAKQYPISSCAAIHRLLIAEGRIGVGEVAEGTVRKYIRENDLKQNNPPEPRKKFEHEHVNELWIGDCLHGPYIPDGRKKRKVFLIAIIEDHSRMLVGGRFFFHENSISLELVFKEAIMHFGLPKTFYCDNGSLFASSHLQLACARLGIALIHSRPYDSPSRGKIERFMRTVRQKFLSMLRLPDIDNIDSLNEAFHLWLQDDYHRHMRYGINAKPLDRFMEDIKTTSLKRPTEQELDTAFQITLHRRVKNDSTVSISGVLYECPTEFIGKKIEIRYPSDKPHDLLIYVQDKPVSKLVKLNAHENAKLPHLGIRFSPQEEQS